LVRDEFLTGLLELTETEGWTVWISSHDIEEVERFADRVAILNAGRIDLEEDVDALQARFREIEMVFEEKVPAIEAAPDWMNLRAAGRSARFIDSKFEGEASLAKLREQFPAAQRVNQRSMSLREIFVELARNYRLTENREEVA
ncbi:MAG TPA: ABC transporter ATP-binding protein, partial [Opitutales bacterium]|nr:ABC transporter ATP-binding protein [Opitutales bacterium]